MATSSKLSNPFSTGGGGVHFEAHIQASFVVLMLTGGYAPCLPCWPIVEIKFQGKIDGFDTDDLIVFVENKETGERRKLLCQVKHTIRVTKNDETFARVIQAAWNDFNNPTVFVRDKDAIALITGPLSETDFYPVQWLLNQAKHTKSVDEFYRNVEEANFSPAKSSEKLDAIRHHLMVASGNAKVSKNDVYSFLNQFYMLGYDLGSEAGVVLSLLHSHISQFDQRFPQWIWSRVVDIVQCWNQDGGVIIFDKLPEDLRELFKRRPVTHIPTELTMVQAPPIDGVTNQFQYITDLALANLVGSWKEDSEADKKALSLITAQDYSNWVVKAREILNRPGSPVTITNGEWSITDRQDLWDDLGMWIFDEHLERFKNSAVAVLTERDPKFDLPLDKRSMSQIYGKVLAHSSAIRSGIAEGLAGMGSRSGALINCSEQKAEITAWLAVREILAEADWILWASLNNLLPLLAEAAPDAFLTALETALRIPNGPFDVLFAQEGDGFTGGNYLTGALWALEGLAWDETFLVRCCMILGELATHDPGGQWTNRPLNSLVTILLPWLPQTAAPSGKRVAAVRTLAKEFPEIAWKLLIGLLPNQNQVTTGSYKPVWRRLIPADVEKGVTNHEYWLQVSLYAELAVSLADHQPAMLGELIDHFDALPEPSSGRLLDVLSSATVAILPEPDRQLLWTRLTRFASKQRRFRTSESPSKEELLSVIDAVAAQLAPPSPFLASQYLFGERDYDLFDWQNDLDEQRKLLGTRRENAIKEIVREGDIKAVIAFARAVDSPRQVGLTFGGIADPDTDGALLPEYLTSSDQRVSAFIAGYIWSRHNTTGWSWVDELGRSQWSAAQVGYFLGRLPFTSATWVRASMWLGEHEGEYWSRTNVNPYIADGDLGIAISKLLEYGRPLDAIECLYRMVHDKQEINFELCVRALYGALSATPQHNSMDTYHTVELLKMLQEVPELTSDDLFRLEWAYLPLLVHHEGAAPRYLESRLAADPDLFCEVIRLIYRSHKPEEETIEPTKDKKVIAHNAWQLLHTWRVPPGLQADGSFDTAHFSYWLERAKEICSESGHLEVGLQQVGQVLIHTPVDPDGLWINHVVAEALNSRDADELRRGYEMGVFNSRGVHWIDPSGAPELELAAQFKQKAEDVENAGYYRFSTTLRRLAEDYTREADRIISDHQRENSN